MVCNLSDRILSASGRLLELLQMVSEPNTDQCASKNVVLRSGVDTE